ncbi:MAG: hypothetical protein LBU41_02755, partial [Clostridiales Family XIII bacterium]|nr:hypothetical protein [Clostridiales Family XIII bacterium]
MKFKREKSRNYFLNDTPIPNVFLGEYMLRMPGDFVRVYLYTYMRTMAGDAPATEESIARDLGLKVEDVLSAWAYLEQKRLIRRKVPSTKDGYYTIEFIDLKGGLFVGQRSSDAVHSGSATVLEEKSVRTMFRRIEKALGRPLSDKDYKTV